MADAHGFGKIELQKLRTPDRVTIERLWQGKSVTRTQRITWAERRGSSLFSVEQAQSSRETARAKLQGRPPATGRASIPRRSRPGRGVCGSLGLGTFFELCSLSFELPPSPFHRKQRGTNEGHGLSARFHPKSHRHMASAPVHALSLRSRISPARAGFAWPWLAFITWPLRKLSAATLPAR